jgi:flagellar assembly protein FliH
LSVEKKSGVGLSAALEEAQSIIAAAEQRADDLIQRAKETYKESLEKGYSEGFEEGRLDCARQAVRLIEESGSIGEKLSEQAARLALAITETIIQKSVELDPSIATQIARDALQEAVVGQNVIIVAHPDDIGELENSAMELKRLAGGANVGLESDPNFQRGGCLVRTDFGEVDSTITILVESIAERLELKEQ